MRRISPVKALRQRLGMTQTELAEAFRIPVSTLRDWEQHRSTPDAPARALLRAIDRDDFQALRLLPREEARSSLKRIPMTASSHYSVRMQQTMHRKELT
jgi:transcriptional regulator with XRE-family HTH domain